MSDTYRLNDSSQLFKDGWRNLSDDSKIQKLASWDCSARFTLGQHRKEKQFNRRAHLKLKKEHNQGQETT